MKSIWKGTWLFGLPLALVLGVAVTLAQNGDTAYKPKRINRAVELLAEGQPIYYTGSHTGAPGGLGDAAASFEQGKKDAQTFADYISYDMEHTAYDIVGLTAYMKGLVAGGPTKSGHRTPAVIVNVPVNGLDEATVRANAWMFQQVLAAGVHGIMLTHADTPGAIRAFVKRSGSRSTNRVSDQCSARGTGGARVRPGGADLGDFAARVRTKGRSVAVQPQRGASAGRKGRRQIRAGKCSREPESSGHRDGGVGTGRHGVVAGRALRPGIGQRSQNAGCTVKGTGSLQSEPHRVPEFVGRHRRSGHDQGRRDGGTGQPADRRDRPPVYQTEDAVVGLPMRIVAAK